MIDYTREDFARKDQRYDVILGSVAEGVLASAACSVLVVRLGPA